MSFLAPTNERRELVKFWVECTQALTIIGAIIGAVVTYFWHYDTRTLGLRAPYDEKQLSLYLEAARVTARLAKTPTDENTINRFWELYWGELPFVEFLGVKAKMKAVCVARFTVVECGDEPGQLEKVPNSANVKAALDLSTCASAEIRKKWERTAPRKPGVPEKCPAD